MCRFNLLNGYVGSKAPYTSKIKALFDPTCTKYLEPFAGGAAVFFSNYNGQYEKEGLNDLNPNIALLYMSLEDEETREATVDAILSIRKPDDEDIAKEQFRRAKERMLKGYQKAKAIPKEQWSELCKNIFIVYSQSFNCAAMNYSKQKSNAKYQMETKQNLMNAVERLQTAPQIFNLDGLKLIEKNKHKKEIQMYMDPPYLGLYRRCSTLYKTEMAGLNAHIDLAYTIADAQSAIVISGYRSQYKDVPTIYDAILGDEWHCFKLADTYKNCEVMKLGEHKNKAYEFVWTNRVPEHAGLYLSMHDYKENITLDEYWERIKFACNNHLVPDKHTAEYNETYQKLYHKKLLGEG